LGDAVSYFTAVLARNGAKWAARPIDVDAVGDAAELTDLTSRLQLEADGGEPILLLVEREDAWWAVLRVDGDDDARVFVSDVEGIGRSPYAGLLEAGVEAVSGHVYGGDLDVLSDLGTSPEELRDMCDDELVPMDAMAALAESGGFAEALDSLR
jgi:putative tRNA adenosine deaminase-associated protein